MSDAAVVKVQPLCRVCAAPCPHSDPARACTLHLCGHHLGVAIQRVSSDLNALLFAGRDVPTTLCPVCEHTAPPSLSILGQNVHEGCVLAAVQPHALAHILEALKGIGEDLAALRRERGV